MSFELSKMLPQLGLAVLYYSTIQYYIFLFTDTDTDTEVGSKVSSKVSSIVLYSAIM